MSRRVGWQLLRIELFTFLRQRLREIVEAVVAPVKVWYRARRNQSILKYEVLRKAEKNGAELERAQSPSGSFVSLSLF